MFSAECRIECSSRWRFIKSICGRGKVTLLALISFPCVCVHCPSCCVGGCSFNHKELVKEKVYWVGEACGISLVGEATHRMTNMHRSLLHLFRICIDTDFFPLISVWKYFLKCPYSSCSCYRVGWHRWPFCFPITLFGKRKGPLFPE